MVSVACGGFSHNKSLDLGGDVGVFPLSKGTMMQHVVWLERGGKRNHDGNVRDKTEETVGPKGSEAEIVRKFVNGQEEGLVRRGAENVRGRNE